MEIERQEVPVRAPPPNPTEHREQVKPTGSCVVGPQEPCVDDWREDWITLHYIEEDLQKFEETDSETHDKLQMPFLDGQEVE